MQLGNKNFSFFPSALRRGWRGRGAICLYLERLFSILMGGLILPVASRTQIMGKVLKFRIHESVYASLSQSKFYVGNKISSNICTRKCEIMANIISILFSTFVEFDFFFFLFNVVFTSFVWGYVHVPTVYLEKLSLCFRKCGNDDILGRYFEFVTYIAIISVHSNVHVTYIVNILRRYACIAFSKRVPIFTIWSQMNGLDCTSLLTRALLVECWFFLIFRKYE